MVRGENKARGASQLGSLPLFLSLFLLLLAFFIFLNSISTIVTGKSDDVLDSVRASFAAVLKDGTGTGVFEGEPDQQDDRGLRKELLQAFSPLLSATELLRERRGNPFYVDLNVAKVFRETGIDPKQSFRDFAALVGPVLARERVDRSAELRFWFPFPKDEADLSLNRKRAARLAEILIGAGAPRSHVSIGLRDVRRAGVIRVAIQLGKPEGARP